MYISAGRFRLNSMTSLPSLMRTYQHLKKQWQNTPGFSQSRFQIDTDLSFWMMSAWSHRDDFYESAQDQKQQIAFNPMKPQCAEVCFTHWMSPFDDLPTWDDIQKALQFKGVFQRQTLSSLRSFLKPSPLYKQLYQASNQS